jgi:hypothetical protein
MAQPVLPRNPAENCRSDRLVPLFAAFSMKPLLRLVVLWSLHAAITGALLADEREESLPLFQNRKVSLVFPSDYRFASVKSDVGIVSVSLADPNEKLSLSIRFLPATDEFYASARSRKEFIDDAFRHYVASSVEKAMQFEELEPKTGAGTYTVFTDASLVGKSSLPPNEYLHCTMGVKSWPGVVAVFSLFSNDTTSKEYQAVMRMLRESVYEKPVPLR